MTTPKVESASLPRADLLSTPTLDALVRCRLTVLARANQLLDSSVASVPLEQTDSLAPMTALLMTSLEELKVAEEELREQNNRLLDRRMAEERQLFHYRQLFQHTPLPALITDINANIVEANEAASLLFRREARYLDGKPLAALLDRDDRDQFRRQLTRVTPDSTITGWHLRMNRVGDVPVDVRAAVKLVPQLGPTQSGVLYWLLQPDLPSD